MKKLIVSGCSFTDNYAKTIGLKEWPIWPELLADSLGMELINLGKSGQGNEYIYSSLLDTVIKEKNIGLVIAMWTEFQRLDFFINLKRGSHWIALHFPENEKDRNNISWKNKVMEILHERDLGSDKSNIQRSLRIFFMLQETMKNLNMPFYQLVGCCPINRTRNNVKTVCEEIIDSPYLNLIDKDTFMGWPIFGEIDGWHIDTLLDKYKDVRISSDDTHPNRTGHQIISDMFYRQRRIWRL